MATVYVLTEEREFSLDKGSLILGVYATAEGADDARDVWRAGHGRQPHPFAPPEWDEESVWCRECRRGVTVDRQEVLRG